jgi:hypothetical protein
MARDLVVFRVFLSFLAVLLVAAVMPPSSMVNTASLAVAGVWISLQFHDLSIRRILLTA